VSSPTAATPETAKAPETKIITTGAPAAKEVLPLPPQGPYKPTGIEIQTALKNAGFYAGNLDGKIGPKSKKAIEDFQKANGLKADGKVGPKTWEALSKYSVTPAETIRR
jgi:peptidoglycan hydrolase-like protein with peptidoglycan-binding domain